jgi:pentatricopeptide repeat protein
MAFSRLRPDLFTYTAVVRAALAVDDFSAAEDLLRAMEQGRDRRSDAGVRDYSRTYEARGGGGGGDDDDDLLGDFATSMDRAADSVEELDALAPSPDLFLYNLMVEGYCRCLRWNEALEVVARLRAAGLHPTKDTFAYLVPCLVRARHPDLALDLLPELRNLGIPLDTTM